METPLTPLDFARRAKKLGWSTVFVADAQAFHVGGGSSGQIKGRRLYYSLRSRLQYGVKHFSVPEVLLLGLVTLVLEPIARGCHLAATGRFAEIHFLAQGYWLLARHVFVRAGRENSTSRGIRQP